MQFSTPYYSILHISGNEQRYKEGKFALTGDHRRHWGIKSSLKELGVRVT